MARLHRQSSPYPPPAQSRRLPQPRPSHPSPQPMAWASRPRIMSHSPPPHLVHTPVTVTISGFLIETYPAMTHVPFASVSDQRGKAVKTSEHERYDELYGRCRTCMGHKSGEQLLLCDDCDRGFHMTCLVPILRDVPKGEWHCPNCTRDRNHTLHFRATAVATLRRVLNDIETRPTLPARLRLKFLNIPRPVVQLSRAVSTPTPLLRAQPNYFLNAAPNVRPLHTLPVNKRHTKRSRPPLLQSPPLKTPERTSVFKKVLPDSVSRRRRHLSNLASELTPLAVRLGSADVMNSLRGTQDSLESIGKKRALQDVLETTTAEPPVSTPSKRPRNMPASFSPL